MLIKYRGTRLCAKHYPTRRCKTYNNNDNNNNTSHYYTPYYYYHDYDYFTRSTWCCACIFTRRIDVAARVGNKRRGKSIDGRGGVGRGYERFSPGPRPLPVFIPRRHVSEERRLMPFQYAFSPCPRPSRPPPVVRFPVDKTRALAGNSF